MPSTQIETISTTGLSNAIASGDPQVVTTASVHITGLTGNGSFVPQMRGALNGAAGTAPTPTDCPYDDFINQTSRPKGTPITLDGIYEFSLNGRVLFFNVTALTGSFTATVDTILGGGGSGGSSSGGGATTIADGDDVTLGSTTDAAVTGDNDGTANAHLRGLTKVLGSTVHTVKAGSTAAQTADTALVVAPSPNTTGFVKQPPASATVGQQALSTTATQIVASNSTRSGLVIRNLDSSLTVYLGTANTVTTATGYALPPGQEIALSITTNAWYGISASGTPTVAYIQV